jgi:hypothetical protein
MDKPGDFNALPNPGNPNLQQMYRNHSHNLLKFREHFSVNSLISAARI